MYTNVYTFLYMYVRFFDVCFVDSAFSIHAANSHYIQIDLFTHTYIYIY